MLTYREALRAFADGKTLEFEGPMGWTREFYVQGFSVRDLDNPSPYRIWQAIITINGIDVPEPLRKAPDKLVPYWFPNIHYPDGPTESQWDGDKSDFRRLDHGLVHLTREAAEVHAKALILASGGQV